MQRLVRLFFCLLLAGACLSSSAYQAHATAVSAEGALDPQALEGATLITECNREHAWTFTNQLLDDQGMPTGEHQCKYYQFTPSVTKAYLIVIRPSVHDRHAVLYSTNAAGEIVELDMPATEIERSEGVWDYVIHADLTAGRTYYVKVVSIEGGDVTISVVDGDANVSQPDPVAPCPLSPQANTLITKVGEAGYLADGEPRDMVACYYKGSDTMMPIRMLQDLGVDFTWNAGAQTVIMRFRDRIVQLAIRSSEAMVNGAMIPIIGASGYRVTPELTHGRAMIPLRFVSQHLGLRVRWAPGHLITIAR